MNMSDMIASTGVMMPESYYEQGQVEYEQFLRALEHEAAEFSSITGKPVSLELTEYVTPEQYALSARIDGLSIRFHTLEDVRGWIDRMYPARVGSPNHD